MRRREWETFKGERFADLKAIRQPAVVINGVNDEMIPVRNSYRMVENWPNAVLLVSIPRPLSSSKPSATTRPLDCSRGRGYRGPDESMRG
jgi:hypothetical protein